VFLSLPLFLIFANPKQYLIQDKQAQNYLVEIGKSRDDHYSKQQTTEHEEGSDYMDSEQTGCTCNGYLHNGRGECGEVSTTGCGTWCYVADQNTCQDTRTSIYGAPYSWSCQACGNDKVKFAMTPITEWKWTIYGDHRIYWAKDGVDFETASAFCEGEGGHLPRIMSQGEEKEVKNLMFDIQKAGQLEKDWEMWIGLHSMFRKGSWQHPNTLKSAKYFNFGQSGNPEGRCAVMQPSMEQKWLKRDCNYDNVFGIICQKDPGGFLLVKAQPIGTSAPTVRSYTLSYTVYASRVRVGATVEVKKNDLEAKIDGKGRVKMGKSDCDDGEKGIERDLKTMKRDTTCSKKYDNNDQKVFLKKGKEENKKFCEEVHPKYVPNHICINDTVDYTGHGPVPTHGPHRPNWASFGEYKYCPIERYQHNIEHGSVVMLYHPCLDGKQLSILKKTVSGCIRKHIITPSRLPTLENPLILVAWGCYQKFEFFDLDLVEKFIAQHGLKGPEGHLPKDGVYNFLQVAKATGEENKILCSKK